MRYCRYLAPTGPAYALVEGPDDDLRATAPLDPFPEDLRAAPDPRFAPARLADLPLLPPVTPSKILCIGRNYRDHATELGNDVPREPLLFLKAPSSLLAPGGTIVLPRLSQRVDFEGEIGLVIGRRCRHLGPTEDPRPYLRGYTLVNDVTARDLQKTDGQWSRAKGFDTFCPTGPLVSDEIDLLAAPADLRTRLNGELRQHASTADLLFDIATLLRYLSAAMTLEPGDLIPTGTPAGVGAVNPGDRIQITVEGLGTLSNVAAAESPASA